MSKYPRTKRNVDERAAQKTEEDRRIAREFGKEFFDGDRKYGYGGYYYHPRFWTGVVRDFIKHYNLTKDSKVLDIGCGKGFMLYDLQKALPGITIEGLDISEYAIKNGMEEIRQYLKVGDARDLSRYKDKEFDLVISINTVHNLHAGDCKKALREIQRISKNAFISVDAWRDDKEKDEMTAWNLTAQTMMHTDDWKKFFKEAGYYCDFYWFVPSN